MATASAQRLGRFGRELSIGTRFYWDESDRVPTHLNVSRIPAVWEVRVAFDAKLTDFGPDRMVELPVGSADTRERYSMEHRLVSRVLNGQRFKFLAVGGINTLVGYVLFAGLYKFVFADIPFGYLASLVLSYAGAIVLAFFLYRRFVFPVTGHLLRDFARFVSVYALSIGINAVALPVLVELVQLDPLLAQAIILVSTTLVSYFGHRYFSFRRTDRQDIATKA